MISQAVILDPTTTALIQELQSLRAEFDQFREEVCLERAHDRQRIKALETPEPQPAQRDRGDVLKALIAANDGKLLAKVAREKMRLDASTFSKLVDSMREDIEQKTFYKDKRQKILVLR